MHRPSFVALILVASARPPTLAGFATVRSEPRSLTEFSKSSFNRAIETQAQLAKKAYDSYISEASRLGQMFLSGYGRFVSRTGERPDLSVTNDRSGTNRAGTQLTAAHRVATERKTGAAKRHSRAKQSAKPRR